MKAIYSPVSGSRAHPASRSPRARLFKSLPSLSLSRSRRARFPLVPAIALYKMTPAANRSDTHVAARLRLAQPRRCCRGETLCLRTSRAVPRVDHCHQSRGPGLRATGSLWSALLNAHLVKRPSDRQLLNQSAFEAESQADFARARKALRLVLDSGKATSNDYNSFAWLALFDNHLDAESIQAEHRPIS